MENKLTSRPKPQFPKHLDKFKPFFFKLKSPLGPPYIGNFTFEVDRLHYEETKYIKAEASNKTVIEMTKELIDRGLAIRAESVAMHYPKYEDTKWWTVKRSSYMERFESMYSIKTIGKNKGISPMEFFKPFICWAIEAGYEYFQVAEVLERAPSTIRIYANEYGYKEHTRVVTRTPDMTGKVSRTETTREAPIGSAQEFDFTKAVSIDQGTHSLKIDRETPLLSKELDALFEEAREYDKKRLLNESQRKAEQCKALGYTIHHAIEEFERLGFDASITLTKIHIQITTKDE